MPSVSIKPNSGRPGLIRVAKASAKRLIKSTKRTLNLTSLQPTKVPLPMDHVNVNWVALSALGAVLFVMLLTASSNLLLSSRTPKVPGFALPTAEPAAATSAGPAAPAEPPLPALLAKADAAKGAQLAKVCQTCHNFEKGAGAKIGPPLYGVVGRPIASVAGFAYSDSLKAVGGNWTYEALNTMVGNPKMEASGTKMTYPGEKDPQKRADILAYLQSLSELPVPFPK